MLMPERNKCIQNSWKHNSMLCMFQSELSLHTNEGFFYTIMEFGTVKTIPEIVITIHLCGGALGGGVSQN